MKKYKENPSKFERYCVLRIKRRRRGMKCDSLNLRNVLPPPQCYSDNTLTIAPREIDGEKEEAVHYFSLFADLAGWKGE